MKKLVSFQILFKNVLCVCMFLWPICMDMRHVPMGGQKRVSDLLNLGVTDGHERPVWAFAENLTTPLQVQQARSTTKLSLLP